MGCAAAFGLLERTMELGMAPRANLNPESATAEQGERDLKQQQWSMQIQRPLLSSWISEECI